MVRKGWKDGLGGMRVGRGRYVGVVIETIGCKRDKILL